MRSLVEKQREWQCGCTPKTSHRVGIRDRPCSWWRASPAGISIEKSVIDGLAQDVFRLLLVEVIADFVLSVVGLPTGV